MCITNFETQNIYSGNNVKGRICIYVYKYIK